MAAIGASQTATALPVSMSPDAAIDTLPQLNAEKAPSAHLLPPTQQQRAKRAPPRQKSEGLASALCDWLERHQIGLSVNLILLLFLTHTLFPRARTATSRFFRLSYYDPEANVYNRGPDDLYFVAFAIVIFTALRAATMDYILKPYAQWKGLNKRKTTRFSEQAWILIYDSFFWSVGMYIYANSAYFFNLKELWTNYPTRSMSLTMKWYYLLQFGFWLQQIIVVNIEERRKDHWQMFTHHIFTCALLLTSYGIYEERVGNVILCIMDLGDILLALAKILKYLGFTTICDLTFGIFILDWFVARHCMYLLVCWSLYSTAPGIMLYGCYESATGKMITPDGGTAIWRNVLHAYRDPEGPVCFNRPIRLGFLSLLLGLQVLTVLWFCMILQVAYRVITGKGANDNRSDDEGEEVEEEEEETFSSEEMRALESQVALKAGGSSVGSGPIEEEVIDVDELRFTRRSSPRIQKKKMSGLSSGIHIPGHSEPKELLGRIGCEKPL